MPLSASPLAPESLVALFESCPYDIGTLSVGDYHLEFAWAENLDPLVDQLASQPIDHPDVVDERMPYWAKAWPSSRLLAETVLKWDPLPIGPWLELGCGPGLAGIAAGLRGKSGVLTDYAPQALALARANWAHNLSSPADTRLLDWRAPLEDLRAPWILASDVVYEARSFAPLLVCLDTLLVEGGEVWLSEAGRELATPFFELMPEAGWSREIIAQRGRVTVSRLTRAGSV